MELTTVKHTQKKKFRKHINNSEDDENLLDRISELPQELLARILCLLSFEEVVRTSVLSRRWRDLWKFITVSINFDASKTLMLSRRKLQKHRKGYVEWITRVLNSHKAPAIDELRVRCDLTPKYARKIDRWIEVALMKKVRRLELDLQSRSWKRLAADEYGEFPDSECYEFGQKFCGSSEIKFLTSLCFKHVNVSGQVLESLLSGCPLLETLHVSHSQSAQLTKLDVCGPSLRLKHLHICFCKRLKSIEVYAPNLVSFEYSSRTARHLVLRYVPQLRDVSYGLPWNDVWDDVLQAFPSCLATCASQLVNLSLQFPFEVEKILRYPKLPNLRYLTCEVRYFIFERERKGLLNLSLFVDSSPLLHKFKVELEMVVERRPKKSRGEIEKVIKGVERMIKKRRRVEMKSLREVEIVGFVGAEADTALLVYLAKTALNLDKFVVNTCPPHWSIGWTKDEDKARRLAYGLLLEHQPQGPNIHVL